MRDRIVSVVRANLMGRKGYTPYCGNGKCTEMPRTFFDGEQFECRHCNWRSDFPSEFITEYKNKWSKEDIMKNKLGNLLFQLGNLHTAVIEAYTEMYGEAPPAEWYPQLCFTLKGIRDESKGVIYLTDSKPKSNYTLPWTKEEALVIIKENIKRCPESRQGFPCPKEFARAGTGANQLCDKCWDKYAYTTEILAEAYRLKGNNE